MKSRNVQLSGLFVLLNPGIWALMKIYSDPDDDVMRLTGRSRWWRPLQQLPDFLFACWRPGFSCSGVNALPPATWAPLIVGKFDWILSDQVCSAEGKLGLWGPSDEVVGFLMKKRRLSYSGSGFHEKLCSDPKEARVKEHFSFLKLTNLFSLIPFMVFTFHIQAPHNTFEAEAQQRILNCLKLTLMSLYLHL